MPQNSNLPNLELDDFNSNSRLFNRQFGNEINYNPSETDAVIGYFLKRGFQQTAAVNTAAVILDQASRDKIPPYELIDTLKGLSDVQLSNVVAQILNINRPKTSRIGYRIAPTVELFDQRNIIDTERKDIPSQKDQDAVKQSDYIQPGYVEPGYVE